MDFSKGYSKLSLTHRRKAKLTRTQDKDLPTTGPNAATTEKSSATQNSATFLVTPVVVKTFKTEKTSDQRELGKRPMSLSKSAHRHEDEENSLFGPMTNSVIPHEKPKETKEARWEHSESSESTSRSKKHEANQTITYNDFKSETMDSSKGYSKLSLSHRRKVKLMRTQDKDLPTTTGQNAATTEKSRATHNSATFLVTPLVVNTFKTEKSAHRHEDKENFLSGPMTNSVKPHEKPKETMEASMEGSDNSESTSRSKKHKASETITSTSCCVSKIGITQDNDNDFVNPPPKKGQGRSLLSLYHDTPRSVTTGLTQQTEILELHEPLTNHGSNNALMLNVPWFQKIRTKKKLFTKETISCGEPFCNFSSNDPQTFQSHAQTAHNIRLIPCHLCNFKLFPVKEMQKHANNEHGGTWKCPFCDDGIKQKYLPSHIKTEHGYAIGLCLQEQSFSFPEIELSTGLNEILHKPDTVTNIKKSQFIVWYDTSKLRNVLAYEELTPSTLVEKAAFNRPYYQEDDSLPDNQITPEAISFLGFDNGHLAAAANHYNNKLAFNETFLMSNIVPMDCTVNRIVWRQIEFHVRKLAKIWKIRIITGCVYDDHDSLRIKQSVGYVKVHEPTHFYKVILMQRPGEESLLQAFLVPNKKVSQYMSIFYYVSSLDEIEKMTGLGFACMAKKLKLTWCADRMKIKDIHTGPYFQEEDNYDDEVLIRDDDFAYLDYDESELEDMEDMDDCDDDHQETRKEHEFMAVQPTNDTHGYFKDGKFHCSKCQYYSRCKSTFDCHLKFNHDIKNSLHCTKCVYTGSTCQETRQHARQSHDGLRLVPCIGCDYRMFPRNLIRYHHMDFHSGKQQCPFCGKIYASKCILKTHFRRFHRLESGLYEPTHPLCAIDTNIPLYQCLKQVVTYMGEMKTIRKDQYIIVYNVNENRPVFTYERLHLAMMKTKIVSRTGGENYPDDPNLPISQITSEAILYLKYERGHLAAAGNHTNSIVAFSDTFFASNIVPMQSNLNYGLWAALEIHARNLAKKWSFVQIFSGPIYKDMEQRQNSLGHTPVPIPSHFFKVFLLDRQGEQGQMQAFIVPNEMNADGKTMFHYMATIEEVENLTGIKFTDTGNRVMSWDNIRVSYRCWRCCITFLEQTLLDEHNLKSDVKCSICCAVFDTKEEVEYHVSVKHKILCATCNKEFKSNSRLNRHLLIHSTQDPVTCTLCNKDFANTESLKSHIYQMHRGTGMQKCDQCDKEFSNKKNLNSHKRITHSNDRNHKCDICSKTFKNKSHLTRHSHTHIGKMNGADGMKKCDLCVKSFTTKDGLKKHMQNAHSDERKFSCNICSKAFKQNSHLSRHILIHNRRNGKMRLR